MGALPSLTAGCEMRKGENDKVAKMRTYLNATILDLDQNSVQSLELVGSHLGDEGTVVVAEALRTNRSATSADLRWNSIKHKGAGAIAQALMPGGCLLQSLDLFCNDLGNKGAALIAEALKTNRSLMTCGLGWNSIGEEGAAALAALLQVNRCLTELGLERNSIRDQGAEAIAGALKKNPSLRILRLYQNHFSEQAVEVFIAVMEGSNALDIQLVSPGSDSGDTRRSISFDSLPG